ncbi:hypothetical protein BDR04DRAFT_1038197 [Suillus decipiens]|nr:hypothetical protein BDR04DRAFT_1038197 [Suillus decipiens]
MTFHIHEYCYLKLNYKSTINWKLSTDHLWFNYSFHGSLCFDYALIQLTAARTVFAKIILMFKCKVSDVSTFQFVNAVPRRELIFIPLMPFIQEAILAHDPEHQEEFLVIKHIDSDMFLHMKEWAC